MKPVINHPDLPAEDTQFISIKESTGESRLWPELARQITLKPLIPKEALIDIPTGDVYMPDEKTQSLEWVAKLEQSFWR